MRHAIERSYYRFAKPVDNGKQGRKFSLQIPRFDADCRKVFTEGKRRFISCLDNELSLFVDVSPFAVNLYLSKIVSTCFVHIAIVNHTRSLQVLPAVLQFCRHTLLHRQEYP